MYNLLQEKKNGWWKFIDCWDELRPRQLYAEKPSIVVVVFFLVENKFKETREKVVRQEGWKGFKKLVASKKQGQSSCKNAHSIWPKLEAESFRFVEGEKRLSSEKWKGERKKGVLGTWLCRNF